jgi:hypothetical protein
VLGEEEFISILFYLAGGRIKGLTRIHKVVFLVEKILGINVFRFEPWKFSPRSYELEESLKNLEKKGLLRIYTEVPDPASRLLGEAPVKVCKASAELIAAGEEAYKKLADTDPIKALYLKKLVLSALSVPLTYLLAYIYSRYPEMIIKSTIRDKVEEWRNVYGLRLSKQS